MKLINKNILIRISILPFGLLSLLAAGCASPAHRYVAGTPYQAEKKSYGLSISKASTEFKSFQKATFKGNQYTDREDAKLYAQLKAFEYCMEQNQIPMLGEIENGSIQYSWTQVSSTTSYFTDSRGNLVPATSVYSYPVSQDYPQYTTYFYCFDKLRVLDQPDVEMAAIPAAQTILLVKDFKGGLGVVNEGQKTSILKTGDLITHINNKRIVDHAAKTEMLLELKDLKFVDITLIRNSKTLQLKVPVGDITLQVSPSIVNEVVEICTALKNRRTEFLKHVQNDFLTARKSVEDFTSPALNVCDKLAHFIEKSTYISK